MGSIEKGTAIKVDYDFDLVIYENKAHSIEEPSDLKDVVKDSLKIISSMSFGDVQMVRTKNNIIKAIIDEIEFDICVAMNFDQNTTKQREEVMARIRKLSDPLYQS
jgi:hypothetical protein